MKQKTEAALFSLCPQNNQASLCENAIKCIQRVTVHGWRSLLEQRQKWQSFVYALFHMLHIAD